MAHILKTQALEDAQQELENEFNFDILDDSDGKLDISIFISFFLSLYK